MCGIAAVIDVEGAKSLTNEMLRGLHHRGDFSDPVVGITPAIAMGTRRLRILDWDRAVQPQWSYDRQWIMVFNGEIYNHDQLREQLSREGVTFTTRGDTEVLVNGIALHGEQFVSQLNGMFAFVAYNPVRKKIIAGRDPLGVKPLYYVQTRSGILFCSEITPLLGVAKSGDVTTLEPGHLFIEGAQLPWHSKIDIQVGSDLRDNAIQLLALLEEAVRIRLPDKNLPLAVKFGGGIDSTLILHFARKYRPDTRAYFIGNQEGKDYRYAIEYAEKTDLDLQIIPFEPENVFSIIETIVDSVETFEPTIVRNAVFSYLLAERIHSDGIRVALCGEGADELFWGYPEMRLSKDIAKTSDEFLGDLHRTQLQRVDRCSMRNTLEAREPFLDPNVVQFAKRAPSGHKIGFYENRICEKILLRELYKLIPELPESIAKRDKVVFVDGAGMSDNDKFSGPFYHFAKESISKKEFQNGLIEFREFSPETEEDVFYLRILQKKIDIHRVPDLKRRPAMNRKMKIGDEN